MKATFAHHGVGEGSAMIFKRTDRTQVLARLAAADIYLDSFPFAGPPPCSDPLQLGIPSVASEGQTFRSPWGRRC